MVHGATAVKFVNCYKTEIEARLRSRDHVNASSASLAIRARHRDVGLAAPQTRMDRLLGRANFEIGSGSVECASRLVTTRFKRASMRWEGSGIAAVLEVGIGRVIGTHDVSWQRARARSVAA